MFVKNRLDLRLKEYYSSDTDGFDITGWELETFDFIEINIPGEEGKFIRASITREGSLHRGTIPLYDVERIKIPHIDWIEFKRNNTLDKLI